MNHEPILPLNLPMASYMPRVPTSRSDPHALTQLDIRGVGVSVYVWCSGTTWRAEVHAGRHEVIIVNALGRTEALARVRDSVLGNTDIARALGIAADRRWSANPYWTGR